MAITLTVMTVHGSSLKFISLIWESPPPQVINPRKYHIKEQENYYVVNSHIIRRFRCRWVTGFITLLNKLENCNPQWLIISLCVFVLRHVLQHESIPHKPTQNLKRTNIIMQLNKINASINCYHPIRSSVTKSKMLKIYSATWWSRSGKQCVQTVVHLHVW